MSVSSMNAARRHPRKGTGDTLLLACGALAREVIEFVELNDWSCFTVECLPAKLHWQPALIPPAVRDKIRKARPRFERIYVLYGDCGTAGELDRVLAEEGVERIGGPHCFSFFAGNDRYAAAADGEDGATTFYLTDFFVRHFDRFLWSGLGLDRYPELRDMYFGNYTKAVYIAQTDDAELDAKFAARACPVEAITVYDDDGEQLIPQGLLWLALDDFGEVRYGFIEIVAETP